MPRLRQVPRSEVHDELTLKMYDQLFGDRDPVAEPGTATGTPGDWWTVYALVPDVLDHAVPWLRAVREPRPNRPPCSVSWARPAPAGRPAASSSSPSTARRAAASASAAKIEAITAGRSRTASPLSNVRCWPTPMPWSSRGRVARRDLRRSAASTSTTRQILEFTYITMMYTMHAIMSRALRMEFDDRDDPIVEVAAPDDAMARDIGADISSGEAE